MSEPQVEPVSEPAPELEETLDSTAIRAQSILDEVRAQPFLKSFLSQIYSGKSGEKSSQSEGKADDDFYTSLMSEGEPLSEEADPAIAQDAETTDPFWYY